MVNRVYVEKQAPYAVKAKELKEEIKSFLGINTVTGVRELVRYDIENLSADTYKAALNTVFSEPPVDTLYEEEFPYNKDADYIFSVEFLPGQFDQRADSAMQCVKFLNENEEPVIKTAVTYVIEGTLSDDELESVKNFCINPVDSRETNLVKPETLVTEFEDLITDRTIYARVETIDEDGDPYIIYDPQGTDKNSIYNPNLEYFFDDEGNEKVDF